MSSQSQVTVCNLALLSIGVQQQVSSITPSDGSAQADACATLFTFVFEQLARTAKWGCLNKQNALTLVQASQGTPENPSGSALPIPQQPWLYGYLYPADCLLLRQVLCPIIPTAGSGEPQTTVNNAVTPWIPGQYSIPYAIGYATDSTGNPLQLVLTNQESAIANYTVDQSNPQSWDALFTSAYVASLASYLVPALSLDKSLMQMQVSIAERIISMARAMDGNESPVSQDNVPDWLRARQGSTGYYFYGRGNYQAYGQMQWPL